MTTPAPEPLPGYLLDRLARARRMAHPSAMGVGHLSDVSIHLTDKVPDGDVYAAGRTLFVGTGRNPRADVKFAGREAVYAVRVGLADVLAWLGEGVGPPPSRGQDIYDRLVTNNPSYY